MKINVDSYKRLLYNTNMNILNTTFAASLLGKLGKGIPKSFSKAELKKRSDRMKELNKRRCNGKNKLTATKQKSNKTKK